MKFGLKLWARNYRHIEEAAELIRSGIFQYLELMPEPGYSVDLYPSDIPYVIHATKFNPADAAKIDDNRALMRMCTRWADRLKSEVIIVHPGSGSLKHSLEFINAEEWRSDRRIVVENMPFVVDGEQDRLASTPADISVYNRPICLDIGHMIKSALSHFTDYRLFIDGFLKLKPRMAHIMDGYTNDERDQHLAIGEGDYDFRYLVEKLSSAGIEYATLETPWKIPTDTAHQLGKLKLILSS